MKAPKMGLHAEHTPHLQPHFRDIYQTGFPILDVHGIEFASPAVVDLNGDGTLEVLTADSNGCVWAWDAAGVLLPGYPLTTLGDCSDGPRINGPLALGDVDGDGEVEIVAGNRGLSADPGQRARVYVWNPDGSLLPGWPIEIEWNPTSSDSFPEVYTVALGNLSGDPALEILAGSSNNASAPGGDSDRDTPYNMYAWFADGTPLPGFPNYFKSAGIFGHLGAADLNGDNFDEAVVLRDQLYVSTYTGQGLLLAGWPVQTYVDPTLNDFFTNLYMIFTRSGASIGDLDGDGVPEIVVAGNIKDPLQGHEVVASGVLVLESDGQRHPGWELALLAGSRLSDSFQPNMAPALADLDGDGKLEIVVNLFDGTMRALREDGSTLWEYDYAQGSTLFASEPVIGDINGDRSLDVVFGTYSPDHDANDAVGLHALDAFGQPLPGFPLPLTDEGDHTKQGIRAAPTLADLDGDCDLEILAGSWAGTLYVWDLPTPYDASLLPWPTARQNLQRSGAYPSPGTRSPSTKRELPYSFFLPLISTPPCQ